MIATVTRLVEGVLRPDDRVGRGDRGGGAGEASLAGDLAVHRSACQWSLPRGLTTARSAGRLGHRFVRRFMSVFGPVSSIFDFLTFFVMLQVLHASHSEFRSGWFVESLATQILVVFVIRTRRVPFFRSRPSVPMLVAPVTCAHRRGPAVHPARWLPGVRHPAHQLSLHPPRHP
jgi:hypothetical protein